MRKLKAEEIEVRVGTISKAKPKAMLLLYKDARCDMAMLDESYGAGNWQSKYERINDVLYCSIGVFNKEIGEWVWKQSNGVESQGTGEDDPNNKKGEASDSFKRAGFMWGIGRELYEWKDLWIDYDKDKDKFQRYRVTRIAYTEKGEPKDLTIVNSQNKVVYKLESGSYKKDTANPVKTTEQEVESEQEPNVEPIDYVNQVKQENIAIWKELINLAISIYQDNGYEHVAAVQRGKTAPQEYFDELKIPTSKLELVKRNRKPLIDGNVVVVVDTEFLINYQNSVKADADIPF